jgi:hypothetical protein
VLGIKIKTGELVQELLRGIRLHFLRYIKGMEEADLQQAQLGLSHSYSRYVARLLTHDMTPRHSGLL